MTEEIGDIIRSLRQRLGMSQEEFAHALVVTVSTVNRWENGHTKPSKLARKAIEALAQREGARVSFSPVELEKRIGSGGS